MRGVRVWVRLRLMIRVGVVLSVDLHSQVALPIRIWR